jgi:hypothetical protein
MKGTVVRERSEEKLYGEVKVKSKVKKSKAIPVTGLGGL